MHNFSVWVVLVLTAYSGIYYVHCMWTGKAKPVLATWVLMMVMIGLSVWMYWDSPEKTWTGNIGVMAAVLNVAIILIGVIVVNVRDKTLSVAFDRPQKWCLVSGGAVTVFWWLTDEPLISYVLVQIIALIGYFATVKKLWRAKESTEPITVWGAIFIASVFSAYPAFERNDLYAWIYLVRAIPSTALVIYSINRVQRRERIVQDVARFDLERERLEAAGS